VLQADWKTIVENGHYHYAHRGTRLRGVLFEPAFTTNSLAYVTANSTVGGRDLDTIAPTSIPLRAYGASGLVDYELAIYGKHVRVQCTIKRMDTGATLTTFNVAVGASFAWATNTAAVTLATFAGVPLEFTFEALWLNAGTEAELLHIEVHERVLSVSSDLPTS